MSDPLYLVGIDLGTSNCAMAYVELALGAGAPVIDFPIPQLQRLGEVGPRALLPSSLYLPSPHELPSDATRLPWGDSPPWLIGEFARWQGARVSGRSVNSAKSWLCHSGVDRSAPILPWGAPSELGRISPVKASALLLAHMRSAWDFAHPTAALAVQELVITVPASFDEVARALTVNAVRQAGLEKFTLIEEPQAAFYDFTSRHQRDLGQALAAVNLVLVVDVGGGTSDFTLVQTGLAPEGPMLRRLAVGDHLMLGGDNMDAALGRRVEERMLASGGKFSNAQWTQLVQAARLAKETLLSRSPAETYHLSLAGEGSRLLGRSLSAQITRTEVERLILDGFFPACGADEAPRRNPRVALQELGLPYAQDPAITRHLAAFLRRHAPAPGVRFSHFTLAAPASGPTAISVGIPGDSNVKGDNLTLGGGDGVPRPDAVLLNGGVFNSPAIAERLMRVLSSWWLAAPPIPLLPHDSLELAVARGAAYAGLARRGLGIRIGGGTARAFYVGLEKSGSESALALCVIPRGHEEGQAVDLGERVFQLTLGRPVRFPLFSTTAERVERSGEVVPVDDDLEPLPPIHTLLKGATGASGPVPVHLRALLTELGTLELWCVSNITGERWRLEFELRGASSEVSATVTESLPARFGEAREWVERIFGRKPPASRLAEEGKGTPPKDVKQLWGSLEKALGAREEWRVPVLRELWSALFAGAARRRRSIDHERIFFQLAGYTLRPGFGYPLDAWRCEQMFGLFREGVQFNKEKIVWAEYWIMWRRLAGGLNEARHQEIWDGLKPYLAERVPPGQGKSRARPKGIQPEGLEEMVRLAAALEHLSAADKGLLGGWIVARLRHSGLKSGGPWAWALGRLGARVPIYGSVHRTVDPEQATEWVSLLLEPEWSKSEGALFAVSQLARLSGDRARDLDEETRRGVVAALRAAEVSPPWQRMVMEITTLEGADKARALGDTMPLGLQLG